MQEKIIHSVYQAARHPIVRETPAVDFFEGAFFGNGALGAIGCFRFFLVVFFAFTSISLGQQDQAGDLRKFTGRPAKLVWIQDAGETACPLSERPTMKLVGIGTEDGKGEREIISEIGWYRKPVITADGTRVVFGIGPHGPMVSDTHVVGVVNWDGSGKRELLRGVYFEDVFTDPQTGIEWIYGQVLEKRGDKEVPVIRRYRMDDPSVSELIWDKSAVFMFMVSGDGRMASGGGDGGNSSQGLFTLPNGRFLPAAGGCWPSMSPDASNRSWVFAGDHRSIRIFASPDRSGKTSFDTVDFESAPGVSGATEVYHPRWSNDARFFAFTGTYGHGVWNWAADVKLTNEVSEKVEIMLGKFSPDLKSTEGWLVASANNRGDYWPDLWVEPTEEALRELAGAREPEEMLSPEKVEEGVVYSWETGGTPNQIVDPKSGAIRQSGGQFRQSGRFGPHFTMDLSAGGFETEGVAKVLLTEAKAGNAFSWEAVLTPQKDPAEETVVTAFGTKLDKANFVITQERNTLYLRLLTDGVSSSDSLRIPIGHLLAGESNHVVVSYANDTVGVWINGQRVIVPQPFHGRLSAWTSQPLMFGTLPDGSMAWPGLMESIRLLSRDIGEKEARKQHQDFETRTANRVAIEPIVVEARLVGPCAAADPAGISPYRRCLSGQLYDVKNVLQGTLPDKQIVVAQWSVLDAKVVPEYEKLPTEQTLTLHRWEDRPELESERMFSGDFDPAIPLYYDAGFPAGPARKAHDPATRTWRGPDANPNLGGSWEAITPQIPWSDGVSPRASDAAILPKVSQGNREITVNTPVTIRQLEIEAGPVGTANRLQLLADFKVEGTDNPLKITGADGVQIQALGQNLELMGEATLNLGFNGSVQLMGGNSVRRVEVIDRGVGYTKSPKISFVGAGGSGASAEAVMKLDIIDLTRVGEGYTSAPSVLIGAPDIAGGRPVKAVAQIDAKNGYVSSVTVIDAGSGYTKTPLVTLEGGGGKGAAAEASLMLDEIVVTRGGKEFKSPPIVVIEGESRGEASAVSALQNTQIQSGAANLAFKNEGVLEQSASGLRLRAKTATWENAGSWILREGAYFHFDGTPDRENVNAGKLRLSSGSRLGFSTLLNRGEIELGTGVVLGQADFAEADNRILNVEGGRIAVIGGTAQSPVRFGMTAPNSTGKRIVENGSEGSSVPATLDIGDGSDMAVFEILGGQTNVLNHPGSVLRLQKGSTLGLLTNDNGSTNAFTNRDAKILNAGEMHFFGTLRILGNHVGFFGIENRGRLLLGDGAMLVRSPSSSGPGAFYDAAVNPAQLANQPGGLLEGTGTLTYRNDTEKNAADFLVLSNLGILSPGLPGTKPGESTAGNLTFENVNLRIGPPKDDSPENGGTLQINVGQPGQSDLLTLTGGEGAGVFELVQGKGSVLNIVPMTNAPSRGAYRIVTANSVKGTFEVLQFRGQSPVNYKVNYLADGIEVVFP